MAHLISVDVLHSVTGPRKDRRMVPIHDQSLTENSHTIEMLYGRIGRLYKISMSAVITSVPGSGPGQRTWLLDWHTAAILVPAVEIMAVQNIDC
jgi:hypothetical protein